MAIRLSMKPSINMSGMQAAAHIPKIRKFTNRVRIPRLRMAEPKLGKLRF